MTPDDAVAIGKLLAKAGVDVLDLSLAVQGTWNEEEGRKNPYYQFCLYQG